MSFPVNMLDYVLAPWDTFDITLVFAPGRVDGIEHEALEWTSPLDFKPGSDTPNIFPEEGFDFTIFSNSVASIHSPFITADFARTNDGMKLVEIGDGQVSDWPAGTDISPLIMALMGSAVN
jgi:hypothetical protein